MRGGVAPEAGEGVGGGVHGVFLPQRARWGTKVLRATTDTLSGIRKWDDRR